MAVFPTIILLDKPKYMSGSVPKKSLNRTIPNQTVYAFNEEVLRTFGVNFAKTLCVIINFFVFCVALVHTRGADEQMKYPVTSATESIVPALTLHHYL